MAALNGKTQACSPMDTKSYNSDRILDICAISSQRFHNTTGRVVLLHEGFMDEKAIPDKLNTLLVK